MPEKVEKLRAYKLDGKIKIDIEGLTGTEHAFGLLWNKKLSFNEICYKLKISPDKGNDIYIKFGINYM